MIFPAEYGASTSRNTAAELNVILLEPKVAEAFPDSKSVNDTLKAVLAIATRVEASKRP